MLTNDLSLIPNNHLAQTLQRLLIEFDSETVLTVAQRLGYRLLTQSTDTALFFLVLCPDGSLLLASATDKAGEEIDWSVGSFPTLQVFTEFLQSPEDTGNLKSSFPSDTLEVIRRGAERAMMISTLEPGHA